MRKLLVLLGLLIINLGAGAQIYNNFMQAAKYAQADLNYPLALYFYEQASSLVPSDSVVDVYLVNAGLRNVNRELGRYDKAILHEKNCLDILKGFGSGMEPDLMEGYALLADIYGRKKDRPMAECYLDSALLIGVKPEINMAYKKKLATYAGMIYSHIGNWPKAESVYEMAVIFSERYPESDDTQVTLNLYGNSLYHNGKYEDALKLYNRQRDVCERLFGMDSREYQWANYCLANILAYMGRIDEGGALYRDVIAWYRKKMLFDLQSVPSSERDRYLDNMLTIIQNAIPFGMEAGYNEDEFTLTAYEDLLLSKGLLLATEKSTETIIREKGSADEIAAIDRLYDLKWILADLLANPDSDPKAVLNTYADIKTIDARLANACAAYGSNTAFAAIGYDDVKSRLKDNEVLLDFADFKPESKPRQFVCYEIRKKQKYPKVHYICNGAQLDSLLSLENNIWSNLYNGEAGDEMERIIGKPLKQIIRGAETVYYVPSGIFHKLAVEAIPDGEVRLGDNYSFRRLSSARELAEEKPDKNNGAARLYGGLDYSREIKPLPRSIKEVEAIYNLVAASMTPEVLSGSNGTKESFLALSADSPAIIHLSTHGFYYTSDDPDMPNSLQGYKDAMALSGLVMSGGSMSSLQGLLTAGEVSRCNLSDTDIACLGSCYSGQGDVTSEGIYGLQRAFKKAGVQSLVMNLWEASDVATECFMTCFYEDLVNGSRDRHRAFRFARDEVRKKYPSPFYWAGFIMVD